MKEQLSKLIYGKLPPNAKDLERTVLGVMLSYPQSIVSVNEILRKEDFYSENNQYIYEAILEVSQEALVDVPLVIQKLMAMEKIEEVGGFYEIVKLTNDVTGTSLLNIKSYCLIIKQKSVLRGLISISGDIIGRSYEESEDVFDILDEVNFKLKNINNDLSSLKVTTLSTVAMNIIERFDTKVYNAKNGIGNPNEVYTGVEEWDRINGSLFNGLYVIAGRPAMGKGVHLTELCCRMGKKYDIGVINGEMSNEQLLTRIGCNLMSIDNYLWKKNPINVTEEEQELVKNAMNEALSLKLHIDKNREISKVANKIRLWVSKYGVKCVLVDFLTILRVNDNIAKYYTETQKVNYILDVLVSLCEELKIPIILYVQMNREILGRAGVKEPNLADLKQSGAIEELAYQVSFLHRPEYYDPNNKVDEFGESIEGLMYQIIAKHRDGETARLKYQSILKCSQLKSWQQNNTSGWEPVSNAPF